MDKERHFNTPAPAPLQRAVPFVTMILFVMALCTGCSVKQMAMNKLSDVLSKETTTYASDDDPELIKGAIPFSLKLLESVLAENQRHKGLLLAACNIFFSTSLAIGLGLKARILFLVLMPSRMSIDPTSNQNSKK